jgi:hypothetical protein
VAISKARARKLLQRFEGVSEAPHFDRTAFRTPRRIVATLGGDGGDVNFMFDPLERAPFCEIDHSKSGPPTPLFIQPKKGSRGYREPDAMTLFLRSLCVILTLAVASCWSPAATLELEKHSAAAARGQLVEDLGIETLGGVFTPLLTSGQPLPCEKTETFSTAADNQEHVEVRLFRGKAKLARDATLVGRFVIEGLPKLPRGTPNVAVTFSVTADGAVIVRAREKSGHAVRLRRRDG